MNISFRIIGQNVRRFRKAAHLTQAQAAERLNLSLLHYGRLERGERQPSLKQLAAISDMLNTSLESLLKGCMIGNGKFLAAFEAASNQPEGTAEYALVLLDEYREQLKAHIQLLKLREGAIQ